MEEIRISRPNATFQQWEALLRNRNKRQKAGEFIVQGVRPISLAIERGWDVRALIYDSERPLSRWALESIATAGAKRVAMAPDLLQLLSEKSDDASELVAVVSLPPDELSRMPVSASFLGAVFDRPSNPGNIGTMVRSLDAFGGSGLIVTGHAADPYDPRAVRASTGSMLTLPVVRLPSHQHVFDWVRSAREDGHALTVIGTDEDGDQDISEVDLTGPTLLAIGNETAGLSRAWREQCDLVARIPMSGAASSLNAASAATVTFYEAARQRARQSARSGDEIGASDGNRTRAVSLGS